MAELNDHQLHLENLMEQQKSLISQANQMNGELNTKREMIIKIQGAIEYLQQIGVTIPEPEETEELTEEVAEETEVEDE